MTKEEINQLILLIFSEDEEDFKLALNMVMKMECSVVELDVFIGHCNNLLIANLKHSARVKVLISSMGSVLLDKGYEVISAGNNIDRWNSTYDAVIGQIFKNDWKTGTQRTQGNINPLTGNDITLQNPGIYTNPYNPGLTGSPFNTGALINNGTGNQKSPPF